MATMKSIVQLVPTFFYNFHTSDTVEIKHNIIGILRVRSCLRTDIVVPVRDVFRLHYYGLTIIAGVPVHIPVPGSCRITGSVHKIKIIVNEHTLKLWFLVRNCDKNYRTQYRLIETNSPIYRHIHCNIWAHGFPKTIYARSEAAGFLSFLTSSSAFYLCPPQSRLGACHIGH